jgi:hypothetical protein
MFNQLISNKFMSIAQIQNLYLEFLNNFPINLRPIISIGLAVLLVYAIIKIVKKDWIFIVVLIVLLPGSVPIMQSIWQGVVSFVKFLLNTK